MKRIDIYDEISPWGFSLRQLKEEMQTEEEEIEMHINSPGGSVFEGIAIYNYLKQSGKKITCFIDGIAASMASVIAMTADVLIMPENTFLMIHNPWTLSMGEAEQLRNDAVLLDKIKSVMIPAYTSRSGLSEEEIIQMMDEETWLTAAEAADKGFIDIKNVNNLNNDNHKGSKISAYSSIERYAAKISKIPDILKISAKQHAATGQPELKYSEVEYKQAVDAAYDEGKNAAELSVIAGIKLESEKNKKELQEKNQELQELKEKSEAENLHLEEKIKELTNGLSAPEAKSETWEDAVNAHGYVEARKKYPELFQDQINK